MTISVVRVKEGGTRFVVNASLAGKRKRRYFESRSQAEIAVAELLRERNSHGVEFAQLDAVDRAEMMMAYHIAQKYRFSVLEAINAFRERAEVREVRSVTLGSAIRMCLKEKKQSIKERSYEALANTLERFGTGRWNVLLQDIPRSTIFAWLVAGKSRNNKPWKSPTRNGYLINLKTLFNWCVAEGLLAEAPTASINKFKPSDDEIEGWENKNQMLDSDTMDILLRHITMIDPELLPRILLGAFAGLRPEREAALMQWEDIDLEDGTVFVRGAHAKDRQRRYVPMTDNLRLWLKWAKAKGYTFAVNNWEQRWKDARREINLIGKDWPHDGLRKSFASHYCAVHGEEAAKDALGHSSFEMLFKHYRSTVKRSEGEAYFSIRPPVARKSAPASR